MLTLPINALGLPFKRGDTTPIIPDTEWRDDDNSGVWDDDVDGGVWKDGKNE